MSSVNVNQKKAGESVIGGLFVSGLFLAVTAIIFGWVFQNTTLFSDSVVSNIIRQILIGTVFIFVLAIFANYKVLDIMEDHAFTILRFSLIAGMVIFVSILIIPGYIFVSQGESVGFVPIGIAGLILLLFILFWGRIRRRLEISAEWLAIAAKIVLAEPGMIFLSIFQSFVIGVTLITESVTIFAWSSYADANAVDPQIAEYIHYVIGFIYLFFSYFVLYFFDGTITVMAYERIKGRDPTIGQGINAATRSILGILLFALLTTTVKTVFAFLRRFAMQSSNKRNIQGQIIAIVLGLFAAFGEWIYYLISFFTLPIIVIRRKGAYAAMKESLELFSGNLWNIVLSDMGYSFGAFIMTIITAVILAAGGFGYGYTVGAANGLGIPIVSGTIVSVLAITKFFLRPLYTSFVTTIYVYASEGPSGLKVVSSKLKKQIDYSLKQPRAIPRKMR